MITDEEYEIREREMQAIFDSNLGPLAGDEDRVQRIVNRAKFEAICKDSATFVFTSFGPALGSLLGAMFGSSGRKTTPPASNRGDQQETALSSETYKTDLDPGI